MKKTLIEILQKTKNQRINIHEIDDALKNRRINIHSNPEKNDQFIKCIQELMENNILVPLKNATLLQQYGRLPNNYSIHKSSIADAYSPLSNEYRNELLSMSPPINIDYYATHAAQYAKDREFILRINDLVRQSNSDELTANERSYLLFGDEKAITMPAGATVDGNEILKNLKITLCDIKARKVFEPFFFTEHNYYSLKGQIPRTVLIVENKDTFWTLQNAIKSDELEGVNLIIYGEGYAIVKKFEYIEAIGGDTSDRYFYFGDLDKEGIKIYNTLRKKFPEYDIKPAVPFYTYILKKTGPERAQLLRRSRSCDISLSPFIDFFNAETGAVISKIIRDGKYLPQEIINKTDMAELKRYGLF